MNLPTIVSVEPNSPADIAGLRQGDEIVSVCGEQIRDVIQYRMLVDGDDVEFGVRRGGIELDISIEKQAGVPVGVEISAAVFDQVRTCDNHCEFCFIYQLPPGMRRSLYLKDDDYRLSFLYGNFTTLTRFTEADLERVITEGLAPLFVSIHSTDPLLRNDMLRNRRGGPSLRWLRALLDHGVEVHGQIVLCPGLNDGTHLDSTLAGIADEFPELSDVAIVPLGLSKFNTEPRMRVHSAQEAARVVDQVHAWQDRFLEVFGRRMVHAADEFYLVGGRPFPKPETYGDFSMYEDGIGMAASFGVEFTAGVELNTATNAGFFKWVDGAPAEGYRATRWSPVDEAGNRDPSGGASTSTSVVVRRRARGPVAILTGSYGAKVLTPLLKSFAPEPFRRGDLRIVEVINHHFGGNVAVAGLMVGADICRVLDNEPEGHRYLLPDVCLSGNKFLDGMTVDQLPRPVEIIETSGAALRSSIGSIA